MERKNVECDLGHYGAAFNKIKDNAKIGNYIAVFEFNGVTLEMYPDSNVDDIHKIYMLSR